MTKIDVTLECKVLLQTPACSNNSDGTPVASRVNVGALVYIYHQDVVVGILDLTGFHSMDPPLTYVVEVSTPVARGIGWFRIYKVVAE